MAAHVAGVTPGMTHDALIKLGIDSLQEHQLEKAERIFGAINLEDPSNLGGVLGLARTYEAQAQRAKAASDPGAPKRLKDNIEASVQWYLKGAPIMSAAGEFFAAQQTYARVLSLKPGNPSATLGLARTYASQNRDVNAIEYYNDYLNPLKTPDAPPDTLAQAGLELAQACRRSHFNGLALDALQDANRRDRENADVYCEMARTHIDMGQYDKAEADIRMARTKSPGNPEYLDVYARILIGLKNFPSAQAAASNAILLQRDAIRQQPENAALFRTLDAYYVTYQQILVALLSSPDASTNVKFRLDLVRAMQERSAVQQALTLFQCVDVLRRAPQSQQREPRLLEALIDVYAGLNQTSHAQETAGQLLRVDPRNEVAIRVLRPATSQPAASQPGH